MNTTVRNSGITHDRSHKSNLVKVIFDDARLPEEQELTSIMGTLSTSMYMT
jgi:hypothetical protein